MSELRIEAILEALDQGKVGFIVIGGLAVGWHGFVRATKDIDIVPDPAPPNLTRLAAVLERLNARVEGLGEFDPAELPSPLVPEALSGGGNWVLETDLGRLDIMQTQRDLELWAELNDAAVEGELFGRPVRFCDYDGLVKLKRDAARPQDLHDLEQLAIARNEPLG